MQNHWFKLAAYGEPNEVTIDLKGDTDYIDVIDILVNTEVLDLFNKKVVGHVSFIDGVLNIKGLPGDISAWFNTIAYFYRERNGYKPCKFFELMQDINRLTLECSV